MSVIKELSPDRKRYYTALSDYIWENPETAFQENKSSEALCSALEDNGFSVTRGVANIPTAFTGTWGNGKPVIGFLGEFDALSGLSQVPGLSCQKPLVPGGNGHGCGHHLLGVGSLLAAVHVKEYLEANNIPGTVIYFGCPGEEGGSGKTFMAREGAFDGLDCAITWHPLDMNMVATYTNLANYQVAFHFHGRAAHAAAAPYLGRSALDALELMNTGVQYLREHMIPEARIHYAITNAGGVSPGVVQPEAEVLYLIRAPKISDVKELYARVCDIAKGAALMTGTELLPPIFYKACSNIIPNRALAECMMDNMKAMPFPQVEPAWNAYAKELFETYKDNIIPMKRSMIRPGTYINTQGIYQMLDKMVAPGSSDVGDVSWVCPTVQCNTTCLSAGTTEHSWQLVAQGKTELAHEGMLYAARIMAGTALDLLADPAILEEAKKEWKERLGGEEYHCPIPKEIKPRGVRISVD